MAGTNPAVVAVFARALTTFSQGTQYVRSSRRDGAVGQGAKAGSEKKETTTVRAVSRHGRAPC